MDFFSATNDVILTRKHSKPPRWMKHSTGAPQLGCGLRVGGVEGRQVLLVPWWRPTGRQRSSSKVMTMVSLMSVHSILSLGPLNFHRSHHTKIVVTLDPMGKCRVFDSRVERLLLLWLGLFRVWRLAVWWRMEWPASPLLLHAPL